MNFGPFNKMPWKQLEILHKVFRVSLLMLALYISMILVACSRKYNNKGVVTSETYKEKSHFKIATSNATYYVEKNSGGLSSIIDSEGNDWIGYRNSGNVSVPKSAESDFRGLPNLVHGGELNGIGHPGFEVCKSMQLDKNTIKVHSLKGDYAWRWVAYKDHLAVRLDEVNPGRNYWFLYEGVPGGTYDPNEIIWGTQDGIRSEKPDFLKGETLEEKWQWVFFTNNNSKHTLCLIQTERDDNADVMGLMGNSDSGKNSSDGMVVFGFGRSKNTEPLLHRPYTFLVTMYPKAVKDEEGYLALKRHVEELLHQHL